MRQGQYGTVAEWLGTVMRTGGTPVRIRHGETGKSWARVRSPPVPISAKSAWPRLYGAFLEVL